MSRTIQLLIIMAPTARYLFPGTVKQITSRGQALDVILEFDNPRLDIPVTITIDANALLPLKKNTPAYAVILRRKGVKKSCREKKMVTVRHPTQDGWVTIERGPATDAEIAAAKEKAGTHASEAQREAWKNGFLFQSAYHDRIIEVRAKKSGCESENCLYQFETFLRSDRKFWDTIPYGTDCEARIRNVRDGYSHGAGNPTGDREAWSHGYATHAAFKAQFGSDISACADGPTLAGFMYNGDKEGCDVFNTSMFTVKKPGPGNKKSREKDTEEPVIWPVPVNLYEEKGPIGRADVVVTTV